MQLIYSKSYFFNDDFKLNFGQKKECKTDVELMFNGFWKYKIRCHDLYNKFESKYNERNIIFKISDHLIRRNLRILYMK